jgi:FKBP-type peptidyl-prolyl cis-trans isomerase SlyD
VDDNKPRKIVDDIVVVLEYELSVDGKPYESSAEGGPIEFLLGRGTLIPGLEHELYGMEIGDSKNVDVTAANAYGAVDPEAFLEVPRDQFPDDIPMEVGIDLHVRDAEGDMMNATISEVTDSYVKLDFNHPLAGKDLSFKVKVVDLRNATEEEIAHGHVHGTDEDEEDEFEEVTFDDEDLDAFEGEDEDEN